MTASDQAPEILRVAERALLVRFPDPDLARAVARAHALAARLRRTEPDTRRAVERTVAERGSTSVRNERRAETEGERRDERLPLKGEWVLGAGNLLVRFDESCAAREVETFAARLLDVSRIFPFDGSLSDGGAAAFDVASGQEPEPDREKVKSFSGGRVHSFAVAFGHDEGPDLGEVARETGLAEREVVTRFCAAEYTVAFLGFAPGFPYLIGLPPELVVARLASPRTAVPAGSVAIAGPFAGVYPSATPGGWRLLGRAEAALFDPAADPPARLTPGDRVRFLAT